MFDKKGEFEINETIIILFLFTIIVVIGLVAFSRFLDKSIDNDYIEYEIEQFESIFYTSINPSIQCEQLSFCIDGIKLIYFTPRDYSLELTKVYPEIENEVECNEDTYPDCNYYLIGSEKREGARLRTPVLVYDPIHDDYSAYSMEVIQ